MKKQLLFTYLLLITLSFSVTSCGKISSSQKNIESLDSIIVSLEPGQGYAIVNIGTKNDVLLVSSGIYEYEAGKMTAMDAFIYGYDSKNSIMEYGEVVSTGTSCPLSVKDGFLYFGGGHQVDKIYVDEASSSIIIKEFAAETFDINGNITYHYSSSDENFEGEVENDSNLMRLFDEYADAEIVEFTLVNDN